MQTIKTRIAEKIVKGVKTLRSDAELDTAAVVSMLEYPPDPTMGDLAFPCFKLSKTLRMSPVQIASQLCSALEDACVSSVESVSGYLNIKLSNEYLSNVIVPEIIERGDAYGSQDFGKGKMVVLD